MKLIAYLLIQLLIFESCALPAHALAPPSVLDPITRGDGDRRAQEFTAEANRYAAQWLNSRGRYAEAERFWQRSLVATGDGIITPMEIEQRLNADISTLRQELRARPAQPAKQVELGSLLVKRALTREKEGAATLAFQDFSDAEACYSRLLGLIRSDELLYFNLAFINSSLARIIADSLDEPDLVFERASRAVKYWTEAVPRYRKTAERLLKKEPDVIFTNDLGLFDGLTKLRWASLYVAERGGPPLDMRVHDSLITDVLGRWKTGYNRILLLEKLTRYYDEAGDTDEALRLAREIINLGSGLTGPDAEKVGTFDTLRIFAFIEELLEKRADPAERQELESLRSLTEKALSAEQEIRRRTAQVVADTDGKRDGSSLKTQIQNWETLLEILPPRYDVLRALGMYYWALSVQEEERAPKVEYRRKGIAYLERAEKIWQDDPKVLSELCDAYGLEENWDAYDRVARRWLSLFKTPSELAEYHGVIAETYLIHGLPHRALPYFERAMAAMERTDWDERDPRRQRNLINFAALCWHDKPIRARHILEHAAQALEQADLRESPLAAMELARAYNWLAVLYGRRISPSYLDRAHEMAVKFRSLGPQYGESDHFLARFSDVRNPEERALAIEVLERKIEHDPHDAIAVATLAIFYAYRDGSSDKSIPMIEGIAGRQGSEAEELMRTGGTGFAKACVYGAIGNTDAALNWLHKAREEGFQNAAVLSYKLVSDFLQAGRPDEARRELLSFLAGDDSLVWSNYFSFFVEWHAWNVLNRESVHELFVDVLLHEAKTSPLVRKRLEIILSDLGVGLKYLAARLEPLIAQEGADGEEVKELIGLIGKYELEVSRATLVRISSLTVEKRNGFLPLLFSGAYEEGLGPVRDNRTGKDLGALAKTLDQKSAPQTLVKVDQILREHPDHPVVLGLKHRALVLAAQGAYKDRRYSDCLDAIKAAGEIMADLELETLKTKVETLLAVKAMAQPGELMAAYTEIIIPWMRETELDGTLRGELKELTVKAVNLWREEGQVSRAIEVLKSVRPFLSSQDPNDRLVRLLEAVERQYEESRPDARFERHFAAAQQAYQNGSFEEAKNQLGEALLIEAQRMQERGEVRLLEASVNLMLRIIRDESVDPVTLFRKYVTSDQLKQEMDERVKKRLRDMTLEAVKSWEERGELLPAAQALQMAQPAIDDPSTKPLFKLLRSTKRQLVNRAIFAYRAREFEKAQQYIREALEIESNPELQGLARSNERALKVAELLRQDVGKACEAVGDDLRPEDVDETLKGFYRDTVLAAITKLESAGSSDRAIAILRRVGTWLDDSKKTLRARLWLLEESKRRLNEQYELHLAEAQALYTRHEFGKALLEINGAAAIRKTPELDALRGRIELALQVKQARAQDATALYMRFIPVLMEQEPEPDEPLRETCVSLTARAAQVWEERGELIEASRALRQVSAQMDDAQHTLASKLQRVYETLEATARAAYQNKDFDRALPLVEEALNVKRTPGLNILSDHIQLAKKITSAMQEDLFDAYNEYADLNSMRFLDETLRGIYAELILKMAEQQHQEGQTVKAVEILTFFLTHIPSLDDAENTLNRRLAELGPVAEEMERKFTGLIEQVLTDYESGQFGTALVHVNEALVLKPDDKEAEELRGQIQSIQEIKGLRVKKVGEDLARMRQAEAAKAQGGRRLEEKVASQGFEILQRLTDQLEGIRGRAKKFPRDVSQQKHLSPQGILNELIGLEQRHAGFAKDMHGAERAKYNELGMQIGELKKRIKDELSALGQKPGSDSSAQRERKVQGDGIAAALDRLARETVGDDPVAQALQVSYWLLEVGLKSSNQELKMMCAIILADQPKRRTYAPFPLLTKVQMRALLGLMEASLSGAGGTTELRFMSAWGIESMLSLLLKSDPMSRGDEYIDILNRVQSRFLDSVKGPKADMFLAAHALVLGRVLRAGVRAELLSREQLWSRLRLLVDASPEAQVPGNDYLWLLSIVSSALVPLNSSLELYQEADVAEIHSDLQGGMREKLGAARWASSLAFESALEDLNTNKKAKIFLHRALDQIERNVLILASYSYHYLDQDVSAALAVRSFAMRLLEHFLMYQQVSRPVSFKETGKIREHIRTLDGVLGRTHFAPVKRFATSAAWGMLVQTAYRLGLIEETELQDLILSEISQGLYSDQWTRQWSSAMAMLTLKDVVEGKHPVDLLPLSEACERCDEAGRALFDAAALAVIKLRKSHPLEDWILSQTNADKAGPLLYLAGDHIGRWYPTLILHNAPGFPYDTAFKAVLERKNPPLKPHDYATARQRAKAVRGDVADPDEAFKILIQLSPDFEDPADRKLAEILLRRLDRRNRPDGHIYPVPAPFFLGLKNIMMEEIKLRPDRMAEESIALAHGKIEFRLTGEPARTIGPRGQQGDGVGTSWGWGAKVRSTKKETDTLTPVAVPPAAGRLPRTLYPGDEAMMRALDRAFQGEVVSNGRIAKALFEDGATARLVSPTTVSRWMRFPSVAAYESELRERAFETAMAREESASHPFESPAPDIPEEAHPETVETSEIQPGEIAVDARVAHLRKSIPEPEPEDVTLFPGTNTMRDAIDRAVEEFLGRPIFPDMEEFKRAIAKHLNSGRNRSEVPVAAWLEHGWVVRYFEGSYWAARRWHEVQQMENPDEKSWMVPPYTKTPGKVILLKAIEKWGLKSKKGKGYIGQNEVRANLMRYGIVESVSPSLINFWISNDPRIKREAYRMIDKAASAPKTVSPLSEVSKRERSAAITQPPIPAPVPTIKRPANKTTRPEDEEQPVGQVVEQLPKPNDRYSGRSPVPRIWEPFLRARGTSPAGGYKEPELIDPDNKWLKETSEKDTPQKVRTPVPVRQRTRSPRTPTPRYPGDEPLKRAQETAVDVTEEEPVQDTAEELPSEAPQEALVQEAPVEEPPVEEPPAPPQVVEPSQPVNTIKLKLAHRAELDEIERDLRSVQNSFAGFHGMSWGLPDVQKTVDGFEGGLRSLRDLDPGGLKKLDRKRRDRLMAETETHLKDARAQLREWESKTQSGRKDALGDGVVVVVHEQALVTRMGYMAGQIAKGDNGIHFVLALENGTGVDELLSEVNQLKRLQGNGEELTLEHFSLVFGPEELGNHGASLSSTDKILRLIQRRLGNLPVVMVIGPEAFSEGFKRIVEHVIILISDRIPEGGQPDGHDPIYRWFEVLGDAA